MAKGKSKEYPRPVRFVTFVKEDPLVYADDKDYELRVDPIPPVNQYPSSYGESKHITYVDGEATEDLNVGDMVILELTDTQVRGWGNASPPPTYWRIVKDE